MTKLTNLNSAVVLNATDLIYVVQNGVSLKATLAQVSVGAVLTAGRVPFMGAAGVLTDSANLTFAGSTLTVPTVNASTSVVTPLVGTGTDVSFAIQVGAGVTSWNFGNSGVGYPLTPAQDNGQNLGAPGTRVKTVFTPIIDSGTTGSLSLRTGNGTTGFQVVHIPSAVNNLRAIPNTAGNGPILEAGTETNTSLILDAFGSGSVILRTGSTGSGSGTLTQFQVLHTASATRNITITGSNGGNPTIATTAGSLAVSTAILATGEVRAAVTTALPAGGSGAVFIQLSSTSGFGMYVGSGAPTVSAPKGSLYLRSDGTTTNNRMYVNTDGGTTWTAVTTVA